MKKKKSLVKHTHRPRKSSRNYKPLIIGLLAFGAVAYFAISRLPRQTPTPIGINEVTSIPATVTLSLPPTISANSGTDSTVDIMIDTGGAKVTAVQVELTYDQSKISTPTLTQGDFLADKLGTPKIKDGFISFIYVVPLQSDGKSGTGRIATLKFKAQGSDSQISFTSKTMVAAVGTNSNVLQSATGTNIVLASSTTSTTYDQSSTITPPPPALTDIAPAPALATTKTTAQNKPTTSHASPASGSQIPDTNPATTYLPENDYDYSQSNLDNTAVDASSPTSLFARFLSTIKALFTDKP